MSSAGAAVMMVWVAVAAWDRARRRVSASVFEKRARRSMLLLGSKVLW